MGILPCSYEQIPDPTKNQELCGGNLEVIVLPNGRLAHLRCGGWRYLT